jgi:DnaJ like chaperone protein
LDEAAGRALSIWSLIIGGAAGLALGGPLGALLGMVAGLAVGGIVDYAGGVLVPIGNGADDPTQKVAFTIAAIALAAKMAKADGAVTRDEVESFNRLFTVAPEEEANVRFVFDLAKKSSFGFDSYARQVARLFVDQPAVLEDLLGALFAIATADGRVKPAEDAYLGEVARIFGFDEAAYLRIRALHVDGDDEPLDDPYRILGVAPTITDDALRAAYRKLVRENHPDVAMARGLPAEFVGIATQKLARINAAYDRVARGRGIG